MRVTNAKELLEGSFDPEPEVLSKARSSPAAPSAKATFDYSMRARARGICADMFASAFANSTLFLIWKESRASLEVRAIRHHEPLS